MTTQTIGHESSLVYDQSMAVVFVERKIANKFFMDYEVSDGTIGRSVVVEPTTDIIIPPRHFPGTSRFLAIVKDMPYKLFILNDVEMYKPLNNHYLLRVGEEDMVLLKLQGSIETVELNVTI